MRVLVTGGAGFIGSNVVKLLEERGATTYVLDDFSGANPNNLEGLKAEVIHADILDENIFKKLPLVDAIIHEAAITDTTLSDDKKMIAVNFEGFKNILEFCIEKNIPLVYASSAGVYGAAKPPMRETQEPTPLNTYGHSKALCDTHAQKLFATVKSLIVGLRYFNVYGPGEYLKGKSASMVYQLYSQMKKGRRPRIFKFGQQCRDFIYIKDAVRITIEALKLKKSLILNVGTGAARSFNEIISLLNKVLKKKLKPDYFDNPYKGVYQNYTQADVSLLSKLKLRPAFSLEDGISDYVNNYLE